jgi:hypothetical protein
LPDGAHRRESPLLDRVGPARIRININHTRNAIFVEKAEEVERVFRNNYVLCICVIASRNPPTSSDSVAKPTREHPLFNNTARQAILIPALLGATNIENLDAACGILLK